jgi:DNA-binding transcriptional regulator PaaX
MLPQSLMPDNWPGVACHHLVFDVLSRPDLTDLNTHQAAGG